LEEITATVSLSEQQLQPKDTKTEAMQKNYRPILKAQLKNNELWKAAYEDL
jgi:hypothetical protein